MTTARQIQKNISFCADYKIGIVSYCINGAACGDTWKEIVMLFNGTREDLLQPLPEGSFRIAVQGDNFFDDETTEKIVSENILLPAVSMVILVKE
jgi:pullulanase